MLETPCIIIDSSVMDRNVSRMAENARRSGVALRPHTKTHKIPEFAKRQLQAGASGITVAKVSEAEVMAAQGIDDIFIAYPLVVSSKIDRLLALAAHRTMIVGVDSVEGAALLSARAAEAGRRLQVRLELDTGLKRTGVPIERAVDVGRAVAALPYLDVQGIYTYRGALLNGEPTLELDQSGEEEGRLMAEAAQRLRAAGIDVRDVSVGSSPTALHAAAAPGVTEIRPGTYVFYDRMQLKMGVCALEDIAAKVRVTVVSVPSPDTVVVDGGSKTFATDVQPGKPPLFLEGYGQVAGSPEAVLERMNEEHGIVKSPRPHGWKVGDTLDIIPNHICSTINLHNAVWLDEQGERRPIPVAARGMLA